MKTPKPFSSVWAIGERFPREPMMLTYSPERGFFEPITNRNAAPVIGEVVDWRYRGETRDEDVEVWKQFCQERAQ